MREYSGFGVQSSVAVRTIRAGGEWLNTGSRRVTGKIFGWRRLLPPTNVSRVSYTVFARKYRPQTFDEVVGQEHISRTLKNAIEQNRLAHAYIFVGPRGTGKTSTARILAKSLNCQKSEVPTTQPCGECDSCREIAAGNSLDVLEFDAASNTQVDKIREIIIDNVKFAPTRGRYKIYLVDEVHMLSPSSFNALLKTLEEPPAHVKFLFATTDVQKVPTTILSRCQRFDLKRIPTGLIRQHLLAIATKEKIKLAPAAAEAVARGAEGGMRDAESMLDQLVAFCGEKIDEADVLSVFGLTAQQTVAELCERMLEGDTPGALAAVHEQAEAGRDLSRLLSDLITHLRNLLVAQADPGSLSDEHSPETLAVFQEQAGRVKQEKLLELIEQFAGAEGRMRWAPNKKMHFEIAVIRAIQTLGQATLSEVLETLNAMRGGGGSGPAPRVAAKPAAARAASPVAKKPATRSAIEETPAPAANEPAPPSRAAEAPANAEPVPQPVAAENAPTPVAGAPGELWPRLLAEVRKRRPLISSWVQAGTLLGIEGDSALIGFPPGETLAMDAVQGQQRKYLEELLSELAGRPLQIRAQARAGLTPAAAPEPEARKEEAPRDPVEEFKNDPLIRRALEIFRAEIQPA
jgi:DNA polymerase III subunit gamma/tau